MTTPPSVDPRRRRERQRRIPTTTWVGIGITIVLALVGLASDGVGSMLAIAAIVVGMTATYGLILRRRTWLLLPRKRGAAAIGLGVAFAVFVGSMSAYGAGVITPAATPSATHVAISSPKVVAASPKKTPTPSPTPTPVVTTKLVTETDPVPFQTTTVDSPSLAQGTSSVTTAGVNGVETKTYQVTYTGGVETGRVLQSDIVTTPPVTQVTTVGTYVAPPAATCTNGTYVNSAGNTVCRPEAASSAPNGATAKCVDGTYSFSQSRRGTCSSHGGVAQWL